MAFLTTFIGRSTVMNARGTQSRGVQQLLATERKAAEIVAEARRRKAKLLNKIKDEANGEIEGLRKEREKYFKEVMEKHAGNRQRISERAERETQEKLSEMQKSLDDHKDGVIQDLLDLVIDIKPRLPINAVRAEKKKK